MKRSGIRKNNRGDSLIIVIGCIALLSILGAVILAKTADNRMMKQEEQRAQESFAGADKASLQVAAVLETVAQDVVGAAFEDMMIEYSLSASGDDRKARYKQYFNEAIRNMLEPEVSGDNKLEELLKEALDVTDIANLSVSYGDIVTEASTYVDATDKIRIRDVKLSYTANGSETSVTTDICIQAKIPDVETGFRSGVPCDFSDFALVADGGTTVVTAEDMHINGNLYVGGKLDVSGNSVGLNISNMEKVLVGGDIEISGNANIIAQSTADLNNGLGIWANGITVNGSAISTTNASVYVSDDLTVEGQNSTVTMTGDDSEYVGYSGGASTEVSHRKSSAITINNAKNLQLDLSGLGELYISGNSYIRDTKWDVEDGEGTTEVEGVMQGESIAYKDMQAMYLVPGELMEAGHNPVLSGESTTVLDAEYTIGGHDLSEYLDASQKYIMRVSRLDAGATVATYVYLNFKSEEAAAQYVTEYLNSDKGDAIKEQINHLGSGSKILLPGNTKTNANALSYDGTTVEMLPAVDATEQTLLQYRSNRAKNWKSALFSNLTLEGGSPVSSGYKMVKQGILLSDMFSGLGTGATVEDYAVDPLDNTKQYKFIYHEGDLEIDDITSPYRDVKGILVVNGNLKISATGTDIQGLVLVTGSVTVDEGATITANEAAVETLLAKSTIAQYFRGYAEGAGHSFVSSEAVNISFENWSRN